MAQLIDQEKFISHLPTCKHDCVIHLCMDLERYMGRNVLWYFTPQYDFPEYDGCPKAKDYEFGWYGNDLQEGTKQFIKDRCDWASSIIGEKIDSLQKSIVLLKKPHF